MNRKIRGILALPLILLMLLVAVPGVKAQETSISNLTYDSPVVLQQGFVRPEVSFTVTYNGLPSGAFVAWGVSYANGSSVSGPGVVGLGSCWRAKAFCLLRANSTSGTEPGEFELNFTAPQQYSLGVWADMWNMSAMSTIGNSFSSQLFQLTVLPSGAISTSISNLEYPTQPIELSNGMAQANVTYTVAYEGVPDGGELGVSLRYDNQTAYSRSGVSVMSAPDPCTPNSETAGLAECLVKPSSASGTESISFTLTFDSAGQYILHGNAAVVDSFAYVIWASEFNTTDFHIIVSRGSSQVTATTETTTMTIVQLAQGQCSYTSLPFTAQTGEEVAGRFGADTSIDFYILSQQDFNAIQNSSCQLPSTAQPLYAETGVVGYDNPYRSLPFPADGTYYFVFVYPNTSNARLLNGYATVDLTYPATSAPMALNETSTTSSSQITTITTAPITTAPYTAPTTSMTSPPTPSLTYTQQQTVPPQPTLLSYFTQPFVLGTLAAVILAAVVALTLLKRRKQTPPPPPPPPG